MRSFFAFENLDKRFTLCGEFQINEKWQVAIVLNNDTKSINFCYSDGFSTHWGYYSGSFRHKTRRDVLVFDDYPKCPKYVIKALKRATKLFNH